MQKRVAVLVLSCASPPYDQLLRTIRRTWGSRRVSGVDIFYLYGNVERGEPSEELSRYLDGNPPTVEPGGIREIGDVLIAGCADTISEQEDCLLRKRLIAFDHLAAKDEHDLIYTVCAASYVDPVELVRRSAHIAPTGVVSGVVSINPPKTAPFVSGASMLITMDVARELGNRREEIIAGNEFGFRDDLTIGRWIASHMSSVPLAEFIDDVQQVRPLTPEHVFERSATTTVDYVMASEEEQRPIPGAFHYHFHSRQSDKMARFHRRYFEPRLHAVKRRPSGIKYVQIFGERGSGTNYLASLVNKNFAGVEITASFGGKHWYIKDREPRCRPNRSTDYQCVRPLTDSDDTLFIVIYRNPFDWLRSLNAKPFHAPGHRNLSFSEFIRKPWICSESTRVNPIWPENERSHYFIEEAENVLRLRTTKAVHFSSLRSDVEHIAFVNYEELVFDRGVLTEIADRFGITTKHAEPIDDTFYFGGREQQTYTGRRLYAPISVEDLELIRETLDWDVETAIGYGWKDSTKDFLNLSM